MSIIEINGVNPFSGQSDPYLSLSSSVDQESLNVTNTYILEGVLTGCSYADLASSRDLLVESFDWKTDESITGSIEISGVTAGEVVLGEYVSDTALFPRSIAFGSSSYLGSLRYTINLDEINGYGDQDDEGIINKVHTETTSTTEDGCVSVSVNLSCSPDANMQECWGLQSGSNWITGRLKQPDVGYLSRESLTPLKTESLTIDPVTLEVSYSSSYGVDCSSQGSNLAGGGATNVDYDFTHCTDTETENQSCSEDTRLTTVNHKGEVYSSGKSYNELLQNLETELLGSYDGALISYNLEYQQSTDTLVYSFKTLQDSDGATVYTPKDLVHNNYTVSKDSNHDNGVNTTTVAGSVSLLNPDEYGVDVINNYPESKAKEKAASLAGTEEFLVSEEFTRDTTAGTITYSYKFASDADPSSGVSLDGFSGVARYSVEVKPPVQMYETVPVLNCNDLVFEGVGPSMASAKITITSVPGDGYNTTEWNEKCRDFLLNTFVPARGGLSLTLDTAVVTDSTLVTNYAFTFQAESVTSEEEIDNLRAGMGPSQVAPVGPPLTPWMPPSWVPTP